MPTSVCNSTSRSPSTLLGADIPIVEQLCRLEQLPVTGFRFSVVPVKVKGMGTFLVRAYARVHAADIAEGA